MSGTDAQDETAWLLAASEDELFTRLGEQLFGDGLGAAPVGPRWLLRQGREWFDYNMKAVQNRVCGSPQLKDLVQGSPTALAAIAQAVEPLPGEYRVALTLAALVLRMGLVNFCANWSTLD